MSPNLGQFVVASFISFLKCYTYDVAQKEAIGPLLAEKAPNILQGSDTFKVGGIISDNYYKFTDESYDQRILKSAIIWRSHEEEYSGTFFDSRE